MIPSARQGGQRLQPDQPLVRGADHHHLRRAGHRPAGLGISVRGQHVDRGLIGGQHRLLLQRGAHRLIEPGVLQLPVQPGVRLVDEPGRDGHLQQHVDHAGSHSGGTFP